MLRSEGVRSDILDCALASSVILLFALFEDAQWGVGAREESKTVAPPAAIANAVADALSERGVDAGAVDRYPLTAPRVFALINALAAGGVARPPSLTQRHPVT